VRLNNCNWSDWPLLVVLIGPDCCSWNANAQASTMRKLKLWCQETTVTVDSQVLQQVPSFVYLRSTFQGKDLALGRRAVQLLSNIWKSLDITNTTKVRQMKSLVWPIATYGCEGWTLNKADHRCTEAFEMWCFRRLLRVSWTRMASENT